jgi:glycosyltransferase involved in cell wall biosynthesis
MRILMVAGDTALVQGRKAAFWNTLTVFHKYWERIDIVCPHVSSPVMLRPFDNVFFHPLPPGFLLSPSYTRRATLKLQERHRYDLIVAHAYGIQRLAWGALRAAHQIGAPLIVEVHHIDGWPLAASWTDLLRRQVTKLFIRRAAEYVRAFRVVNGIQLPHCLERLGIPARKHLVLYSAAIDRNVFYPAPREKCFDAIFVGRLVAGKGLELLVDALSLASKRLGTLNALIVGRGPFSGRLRERLERASLARQVTILPEVGDAAQLADLYRSSKTVVCTSFAEGGPRFLIEGMACGLPAVSTPVGLAPEIIRNGENGLRTDGWRADQIARGLIRLLTDGELYSRCSDEAARIASGFEREAILRAYAQRYRECAQG